MAVKMDADTSLALSGIVIGAVIILISADLLSGGKISSLAGGAAASLEAEDS